MDEMDHEARKKTISKQFFLLVFILLIFFIGMISLLCSPVFSVNRVQVSGNTYMSQDEVIRIAGLPDRVNIFRLTTREIQTKLCKDLRIEQAVVQRSFPSTIKIQIIERKPIASVACEYGFLEIDKKGMVLAVHKTITDMQVPIITGVVLHNLYIGDSVLDATCLKVLEYLAQLDETSVNQISEVHIAAPDQIVAYTRNSVQIRLGSTDRLSEKAKATQDFIQNMQTMKQSIEYIDFNFTAPFIKFKNR
ncbi:cell division protein FtsQ/DivIB [Propionispira raffinosivorans]|uniref:cell division protein FtsQ/DivIB n=1 Tax=Propionispira raffinosivorans TaxID=86959 RepID=UPI00035EAFE3|nr:FtsQ-type POTRA domain-containing protein [Propionispira raffinosivorans]